MLEALHNCIAHQDYTRLSRVAVMEHPDRLVFESQGSFFEGTPDEYAIEAHMPRRYRNTTLVTAMTELNMIDHLGYGIERMNRSQARRYLPLPEYDLSDPTMVRLTIWGSVVDEAYTRLLMQRSDLPFDEVMALDRIQKGHPIAEDMLRRLRRKGLVEGAGPASGSRPRSQRQRARRSTTSRGADRAGSTAPPSSQISSRETGLPREPK